MVEFERNGPVLKIAGALTGLQVTEARNAFVRELGVGLSLEVDLSQVTEVDTAGVQVLLWAKREAKARGLAAPFIHHSPAVIEVLEQMNLAATLGDTLVLSPLD